MAFSGAFRCLLFAARQNSSAVTVAARAASTSYLRRTYRVLCTPPSNSSPGTNPPDPHQGPPPFRSGPQPGDSRLPPICDVPHVLWPSFVKTLKNFFLSTFVIRPYLDPEFRAADFMYGAKQALVTVSDRMSNGKFDDLNGLVSSETLEQVKERVGAMSLEQRTSLKVQHTDIYLAFPYQIGMIIYDETSGIQKRFVEVMVAYHIFRGLKELLDSGNVPRDPMRDPEHSKNIMVCNYRFIREYTKGVDDSWTVNKLNHFRPADWL